MFFVYHKIPLSLRLLDHVLLQAPPNAQNNIYFYSKFGTNFFDKSIARKLIVWASKVVQVPS